MFGASISVVWWCAVITNLSEKIGESDLDGDLVCERWLISEGVKAAELQCRYAGRSMREEGESSGQRLGI